MQQKISRNIVIRKLSIALGDIQKKYDSLVSDIEMVSFTADGKPLMCGDGFVQPLDDGKFRVSIGKNGFPSKFHPFVNMDLFCEMMLSVKHEEQHVKQYTEIYKQHTEEARNMALDHVSTFYNSRYYRYNYGNMLHGKLIME